VAKTNAVVVKGREEKNMKRILVVDDNQTICEFLERRLKARGYDVTSVLSGDEALTRVQQEKPDLILLDIVMPGTDGLEVARILRNNKDSSLIPIIMVTAKANDLQSRLDKAELQIEGHVAKPFMTEQLLGEIERVIERSGKG
jgi:CheY-like chemotaxis protein